MSRETGLWMPMFWADYFGDTLHLTTEEHGAYLLLIGVYWRRGSALPDDDEFLSSVTKLGPRKWQRVKSSVAKFFTVEGGFWTHTRVEKEILRSAGRLESARANGKAGGLAKGKLTTTTSTKKEEGGAGAPPYAFVGKIIKLKSQQFEQWRQSYSNIDLIASLQAADDYYAEHPPPDGKWFFAVSRWLQKDNADAAAKKKEATRGDDWW